MQQTDHPRNRVRQPYSGEESDSSTQAKRDRKLSSGKECRRLNSGAKAANSTQAWIQTGLLGRRVRQLHQASRLPTQLRYKCRQISPNVESDSSTRSRGSQLNSGVDTNSSTQARVSQLHSGAEAASSTQAWSITTHLRRRVRQLHQT